MLYPKEDKELKKLLYAVKLYSNKLYLFKNLLKDIKIIFFSVEIVIISKMLTAIVFM